MSLGLAGRWALALGLATLVAVAAAAATVEWTLRGELSTAQERWEQERHAELRLRLELAALPLASASDALRGLEPPADEARRAAWAAERARSFGLDELLWLAPDGRVVSSLQFPGAGGLAHPAAERLLSALRSEPVLWPAFRPGRPRPAWVLGRRVGPSRGGELYAGLLLGEERLGRLAREAQLASLRWGEPGRGEFAVELPLTWQGPGLPQLAASVGLPPGLAGLHTLRSRLLWLALALLGAGLLSAPLLAAGLAGPVHGLARAVRRLGRGEDGVAIPVRGPAETRALGEALRELRERWLVEQQGRLAAEREAAWREIARRVAHELRNATAPLALALENLQARRRQLGEADDPHIDRALATAQDQLGSLGRLAGDFSEFARMPPARGVHCDLPAVLRAAVDASGHPDVRMEGPPSMERRADPEQLRRAVHNLLLNAREAAPHAPVELAWGEAPGQGGYHIELRDRGPGLPPGLRERLGEPFASERGEGHGLGLAVVVQVARSHGGELLALDREGGGTVMRLELRDLPEGGETP